MLLFRFRILDGRDPLELMRQLLVSSDLPKDGVVTPTGLGSSAIDVPDNDTRVTREDNAPAALREALESGKLSYRQFLMAANSYDAFFPFLPDGDVAYAKKLVDLNSCGSIEFQVG